MKVIAHDRDGSVIKGAVVLVMMVLMFLVGCVGSVEGSSEEECGNELRVHDLESVVEKVVGAVAPMGSCASLMRLVSRLGKASTSHANDPLI